MSSTAKSLLHFRVWSFAATRLRTEGFSTTVSMVPHLALSAPLVLPLERAPCKRKNEFCQPWQVLTLYSFSLALKYVECIAHPVAHTYIFDIFVASREGRLSVLITALSAPDRHPTRHLPAAMRLRHQCPPAPFQPVRGLALCGTGAMDTRRDRRI